MNAPNKNLTVYHIDGKSSEDVVGLFLERKINMFSFADCCRTSNTPQYEIHEQIEKTLIINITQSRKYSIFSCHWCS